MAQLYLLFILRIIVFFVCVATFWRAANMENRPTYELNIIWSGLAAIVYLASWLIFGLGWPGIITAQVLLLLGIGVVRAIAYLRETQK